MYKQGWSLPHLVKLLLQDRLPALPANIEVRWRGLKVTNSLAYYSKQLVTPVKVFVVQTPKRHKKSKLVFDLRVSSSFQKDKWSGGVKRILNR